MAGLPSAAAAANAACTASASRRRSRPPPADPPPPPEGPPRAQPPARDERDRMQERREVAQQPVREDLERVQRRVAARVEDPALQEDQPRVAHHAALAAELRFVRRSRLLRRHRPRLVLRPPAALDHVEGEREVVAHTRIDLEVRLAAGRVESAVAGGNVAEPRLELADRHLVAPVEALLVVAVLGRETHLAAEVTEARVGREALDEAAQRVP